MNKKIIGASSLLAAGLIAGSFVGISGANAATDTSGTSSTAAAPTFGNGPQRGPEVQVTGDLATELSNAAIAANPGATVDRVEEDADGKAKYEAHLTLADGSHLTVLFDADKKITGTETAPAFGPGGKHDRAPEVQVTGDLATELSNAAIAANPGATVDRIEEDGDGKAKYEAHLTLADGSHLTVLFDEDKKITGTETGPAFGQDGPRGPRGPHGDDSGFVPPTTDATTPITNG